MSETRHTSGPWEARSDSGDGLTFWEVVRPDPRDKGPDDPNRDCICDLGPAEATGETEANARLIAAAPDLLAACEAVGSLDLPVMLPMRPAHVTPAEWGRLAACIDAVDAAIAKAKGGAR